jgi:hypothetical protein
MGKIIIGLIIGIIVGGAATFLTFVGVPRAAQTSGVLIQAPNAEVRTVAAQVVLKQEIFNSVLQTIFRDMNPPAFPMSYDPGAVASETSMKAAYQSNGTCDGLIRILPQGSGVTTGVKFENSQITAPLAFSGSYNTPFGCIQFSGWAKANFELRFDAAQQAVFGKMNVETVNLDGVNPLIGGIVTPVVQSSINDRVNPIEILRGEQIAPVVKVASSGGNLKASVKDVRAEVTGDELKLFVIYEFSGTPAA